MPNSSPVLLDTHCWLWLESGENEHFSSEVRAWTLEAARRSEILVSAISVWEVGMLEAKRRIALSAPCLEWVERALGAPGTTLVPLTPEIAIESTRLPGEFPADAADRILVATARACHATLLTADERILAYAHRRYLRARPPR